MKRTKIIDAIKRYEEIGLGSTVSVKGWVRTKRGNNAVAFIALNDGSTIKNGDAFIYGGALTLSAEFYLSDRLALGAHVKERFVFGNDTGHFLTQFGVHIKLTIE